MNSFLIIALYALALTGFILIVFPKWKSRWVTLGYGLMLAAVVLAAVWFISGVVSS